MTHPAYANYGPCCVMDCDRPAYYKRDRMCIKHWTRKRRTGTTEPRPRVTRRVEARGYVRIYRPGHQLADAGGWAFEHRIVAYDAQHGQTPSQCEWCWAPVDGWADVQIDHLDFNQSNNEASNLVVSCLTCNTSRQPHADVDLWIRGVAARRIVNTHRAEVDAQTHEIGRMLSR